MDSEQLYSQIRSKKSFLCIGLDSEFEKLPAFLHSNDRPQFTFNQAIILATHQLTVAYKLNTAFYEARGAAGWNEMADTVKFIRSVNNNIFIIADAKRCDIGNSAEMYARAFLDNFGFDAVTVSPYMGSDSVHSFLQRKGKWVILLAVTSNKGADDFQFRKLEESDDLLFETVIKTSLKWGTPDNMMYVAGATRPEMISRIRKHIPGHFLLIPGIGAQGGDLNKVSQQGINPKCGIIVNVSRSVIFADNSENFAQSAFLQASELQREMKDILKKHNLI
jgi:orotidine-5'-phosphate decarboxylase